MTFVNSYAHFKFSDKVKHMVQAFSIWQWRKKATVFTSSLHSFMELKQQHFYVSFSLFGHHGALTYLQEGAKKMRGRKDVPDLLTRPTSIIWVVFAKAFWRISFWPNNKRRGIITLWHQFSTSWWTNHFSVFKLLCLMEKEWSVLYSVPLLLFHSFWSQRLGPRW